MHMLIPARATEVELSIPHKSNRVITARTASGQRVAKPRGLSSTDEFDELNEYEEIP